MAKATKKQLEKKAASMLKAANKIGEKINRMEGALEKKLRPLVKRREKLRNLLDRTRDKIAQLNNSVGWEE